MCGLRYILFRLHRMISIRIQRKLSRHLRKGNVVGISNRVFVFSKFSSAGFLFISFWTTNTVLQGGHQRPRREIILMIMVRFNPDLHATNSHLVLSRSQTIRLESELCSPRFPHDRVVINCNITCGPKHISGRSGNDVSLIHDSE